VVDISGDVAVPGANRDDDEVRMTTASTWVVTTTSIGSGRFAGRRLEGGGVCGDAASNSTAWGHASLRVLERRERGGGDFIGGGILG
jgi:hypothetical protein